MADDERPIDSLLEKTDDFIKTSIELAKYKAIDKITDVIAALIPNIFEALLILTVIFFLNLGLALWLGFVLGKTYVGFFIVAAVYGVAAIVLRIFMYKWIKAKISDYIVKLLLK